MWLSGDVSNNSSPTTMRTQRAIGTKGTYVSEDCGRIERDGRRNGNKSDLLVRNQGLNTVEWFSPASS